MICGKSEKEEGPEKSAMTSSETEIPEEQKQCAFFFMGIGDWEAMPQDFII